MDDTRYGSQSLFPQKGIMMTEFEGNAEKETPSGDESAGRQQMEKGLEGPDPKANLASTPEEVNRPEERSPKTSLETALEYIERGWAPVPVPFKRKNPIIEKWQALRITGEDAPKYFQRRTNVGVLLGEASGGLADADLDCRESVVIGPLLLPATNATFGRRSKPVSHQLYVVELPDEVNRASLQFRDPTAEAPKADEAAGKKSEGMLIELRIGAGGKGSQSIFPGSTHDSGELIEWRRDGEPAAVDFRV